MKLLLITVLVGVALAKPTVQPPRQSEENSTEEVTSAESFPLPRGAAPTSPTSSSVEEEDLQKKPVDKTQTKPEFKSAASSESAEVPAPIPAIRAFQNSHPGFTPMFVGFTPMFTTSDEDDDVVASGTSPAEGSVPRQPESAQPAEGVSAVPTVDALPAEETAPESAQPIAGVYSADSTENAVDPVDKTGVVQPQLTTYSKNYAVVPSYAVAPNVYSVAGVLPAVSHVSTIPFSQNFVHTNQLYTGSNIVYPSSSIYSSPFFYHNQGIVPSYVYHKDD